MNEFLKSIFSVPVFSNDLQKTKTAQMYRGILLSLFVVPALIIASFVVSQSVYLFAPFFIFSISLLYMLRLNHDGKIEVIGALLTSTLFVVLLIIFYFNATVSRPSSIFLGVIIAIAWLLIGRQGAILSALLCSILVAIIIYGEISGVLISKTPAPTPFITWLVFSVGFFIISWVLQLGSSRFEETINDLKNGLELFKSENSKLKQEIINAQESFSISQAGTIQLQATTNKQLAQLKTLSEISQLSLSNLRLEMALNSITQAINSNLGHYHIGIYLLTDNDAYIQIKSSNSESGKRLIANGHKLRVGLEGIVGFVASQGKARIATDVKQDDVFINLQELSKTRSEIALPLKFGNRILGVLDIESEIPNAYRSEDLELYTLIANQISLIIENSRLREEAKEAVEETRTLYQEYTSNAWRIFKKRTGNQNYFYANKEFNAVKETKKLESLTGNSAETTTLPIQLRGETIGFLDIQPAITNRKWTENEMAIIQSAVNRLALALENARLITETQRRAVKERLIGEISTRISSNTNINNIMQTALAEIGRTIPGTEVSIRIKPDQDKQ